MKRLLHVVLSIGLTCSFSSPALAFTSKSKSTLSVAAAGVTESTTFSAGVGNFVTQGTGEPGTPAALSFPGGNNDYRDSGEALRVEVSTNAAGNRVIIYTDNLNGTATPQAQVNTATGIDGGGLVGVTDRTRTVPMLWGLTDANVDYVFTPVAPPGIGATNGIFVTDLAHVATFTTVSSALDNLAMRRCSDLVAVTNTAADGLYPQFFGGPGIDRDLCRQDTGVKVPEAEELSKNIAVVAFGFLGTAGTAPNTTTVAIDTMAVTSPIFVAFSADFRQAPAQNYATSTLTIELVTQ